MLRKRNDSVKSGRGVDGDLGEDFVKPGPDMNFGYPGGTKGGSEGNGHEPSDERSYAGAYTENKSGLTRIEDIQLSWATRDIMDDVETNQDQNVSSDPHNAITAGVNKKQEK